jgi:hypothetical protein
MAVHTSTPHLSRPWSNHTLSTPMALLVHEHSMVSPHILDISYPYHGFTPSTGCIPDLYPSSPLIHARNPCTPNPHPCSSEFMSHKMGGQSLESYTIRCRGNPHATTPNLVPHPRCQNGIACNANTTNRLSGCYTTWITVRDSTLQVYLDMFWGCYPKGG